VSTIRSLFRSLWFNLKGWFSKNTPYVSRDQFRGDISPCVGIPRKHGLFRISEPKSVRVGDKTYTVGDV
jgi:hypothetical protein